MTWIALTTAPNKARAVRKRLRRRGESAYIPAMVSKRIITKGTRPRRKRIITVLMPYVLVRAPEHTSVRALWLHDRDKGALATPPQPLSDGTGLVGGRG
jgi:hypothetical protein